MAVPSPTTSTSIPHGVNAVISPRSLPKQYAIPGNRLRPAIASDDRQVFSTAAPVKKNDVVVVWRRPETLADGEPHAAVLRIDFDLPDNWRVTDVSKVRTSADMIIVFKEVPEGKSYLFRASEIEAIHKWVGIWPAGSAVPQFDLPEPKKEPVSMTNALMPQDGGPLTMSSREIAELTGKDHKNVLRDIRALLGENRDAGLKIEPVDYIDKNGEARPEFLLDKEASLVLVSGYSSYLRLKIVRRWLELEGKAQQPAAPALPANYLEALKALVVSEEEKQIAVQRALIAEQTKAEIGNRREATAMNTASQAVKKVNKLEIELDRSLSYATVKRMQEAYGENSNFNWRVLKQMALDMGLPPVPVPDQNYGKVNAYHAEVWKQAYEVEIPRFDLPGRSSRGSVDRNDKVA